MSSDSDKRIASFLKSFLILMVINYLYCFVLEMFFPNTGLGGLVIIPMTIAVAFVQSISVSLVTKYLSANKVSWIGLILILGFLFMAISFPQDYGGSIIYKTFSE